MGQVAKLTKFTGLQPDLLLQLGSGCAARVNLALGLRADALEGLLTDHDLIELRFASFTSLRNIWRRFPDVVELPTLCSDDAVDACVRGCAEMQAALPGLWQDPPVFEFVPPRAK